jgi:WS/DGAT/MGAT family acyltransferase
VASEPLSAADRSSLASERGPVNMAVGGALVFEGGPGLSYDAVRERLQARLHLIPRYRQKLAEAPLGIAGPAWADDEDFDLDWHLDHARLPAPDGLPDYVGRVMSHKLDRSRPLWELHVVDGLADGGTALVTKMHHALVDGVAAVDVGTVLLDPSSEPLDIPPPAEPWSPRPYDPGAHLARLAATPFMRAQKLALDTARRALETSPRSAADELATGRGSGGGVGRGAGRAARLAGHTRHSARGWQPTRSSWSTTIRRSAGCWSGRWRPRATPCGPRPTEAPRSRRSSARSPT